MGKWFNGRLIHTRSPIETKSTGDGNQPLPTKMAHIKAFNGLRLKFGIVRSQMHTFLAPRPDLSCCSFYSCDGTPANIAATVLYNTYLPFSDFELIRNPYCIFARKAL